MYDQEYYRDLIHNMLGWETVLYSRRKTFRQPNMANDDALSKFKVFNYFRMIL